MTPKNRHGHHCGRVPYPLDGIPEGTTAEQLQVLIDGAQLELVRLTQEEDAQRIQEVEEEVERKQVEEEERWKAVDKEEARRVVQEQQEKETDEETMMQKMRRKQKGKAKTRVVKWKWDSLPGLSKRARGVTMDSGDEGEVNNLCITCFFLLEDC